VGEWFVGSYVYGAHLSRWLEWNDYNRLLPENDMERLSGMACVAQDVVADQARRKLPVSVTGPRFCTTARERVYITASGREIELGRTRGL
jgi:hypothetical protein